MFFHLQQHKKNGMTESGFVLVFSMVILLMLSFLGIWALRTSTSELNVAGGLQQADRQFNLAEGAANNEAVGVGFSLKTFYQISNPALRNQRLAPATDATFDPGNDTPNTFAGITAADPTTWPWDNLLQNYVSPPVNTPSEFDYRYLVTYLYEEDRAFIGYSASDFSAYKHQIQGTTVTAPVVVELGGIRIGPKSSL